MNVAVLSRIEREIVELSRQDQLWLIERLVRRLRKDTTIISATDDELAAMAADPEVVRELRTINAEFRVTEMDGLETDRGDPSR